MTTRRSKLQEQAAELLNQEAETGAVPGVPEGVPAQVNIRYNTTMPTVDRRPSTVDSNDELNRLALEHDDELPADALSEFLERWANFAGYSCMVLRLPDASTRRAHGSMYNRPHFGQPEQLGAVTFDPNPINFISSLQFVNNNSGGSFQLWLVDYNGARIPDATLWSYTIGDPPRNQNTNTNAPGSTAIATQAQPAPRERERSESERKLEEAKDRLFNSALERALNPPVALPAAGNGLSGEDQAALYLFKQTEFLPTMFTKMTTLAEQAAGTATAKDPSLRDRALDALVTVATNNPQIVERVGGVLERIVARLLPDPRFDGPPLQAPGYYQQPQPQPQAAPQPQPASVDLPDELDNPDDDEDAEIMDILDELVTFFNSAEPLTLDAPVVQQLVKDYPIKARMALRMIASQPLDDIIEWIKTTGGALYVSMLDGPASGPYLRQRLGEFKGLCEAARDKAQAPQAAPASEQSEIRNPKSEI